MGAYGIYVWTSIGITVGSMALYLIYVFYTGHPRAPTCHPRALTCHPRESGDPGPGDSK